MKKNKRSNVITGVSGEYFVAAELSRMGLIASLTLRNTEGIDILVSNRTASKSVGIQVKTSSGSASRWMLNAKAEHFHADNLFYVFVKLSNEGQRPVFHVVPSKHVASFISHSHKRWLRTPGRHGNKHKDSAMRSFRDMKDEFLEKWNLLGL